MQKPAEKDKLIRNFITIIRQWKRWPTSAEVQMSARNDPDLAWDSTYNRIGKTKTDRAATILAYCNENNDFSDVAAICELLTGPDNAVSGEPETAGSSETITFGFVYLMKSGKFYKIGHSNSPGRREYELASHRPEGIVTVHKIKTDDPTGIEA